MNNVYNIFEQRGFINQCSDALALRELLGREKISCYIGFDPTADSFHVGSLVPIMALAWMQRTGHHPIVIMGGGTALVGDPSGKAEARSLLSPEQIKVHIGMLKKEFRRFIKFGKDGALLLNNADWLVKKRYIDFLREVGIYFKVNVMIKAESCNKRLESQAGMPFNEFNYPLLQAYDFLHLYKNHNCVLQMGGSDQWGNITDGLDLIKRVAGGRAFALTFPLLEIGGAKMSQTGGGKKVWLNPKKTTPYEYYQFWRNTGDEDVAKFLRLFTFLPLEQIDKHTKGLGGEELNFAKQLLAYEATKLAHGKKAADEAVQISDKLFAKVDIAISTPEITGDITEGYPNVEIPFADFENGIWPAELLKRAGLVESTSAGKKLVAGGGAYLNRERIPDSESKIFADRLNEKGSLLLQRGKKEFVVIKAVK